MSNELAKSGATGTLTIRTMDDLARLGSMLAASGFFTDAKEAAQAGVKVLAGLEMGIGAFSAMTGVHVIKGKPSVGAGLMAAAVKRSGKYDYRVRVHTSEACEIEFREAGEVAGVSSFTLEDAKLAGLLGNDNWKRNPKNMLFARALSNGVRWYCPDVFSASTYTPEELGAEVDGDGEVVTVQVEPVEQPKAKGKKEQAQIAPEASPADEAPFEDGHVDEPIEMITPADTLAIAAALKPLKLSRDEARKAVELVINRGIVTMTDLTRGEGEALAGMTTDQWADALESFREVA